MRYFIYETKIMSLYIHPENQQLLWNIMNKIPILTDFFAPYPQAHKEQWFKSVIQLFYEKYKTKRLQLNDLHQLNQETIAYIVQTIREKTQPQQQVHAPSTTDAENKQERIDKKQEFYNHQFTARQTEYNSMLNKQAPPEVNFREKEEDTAISNMDELIRQHMTQRENELKQYSPQPPISPPVNMQATIEKEIVTEHKPKRNVSWTTEDVITTYEERLHMQSEEITYLKTVVTSLSSTIETICKEMIQLKQYVDLSSSEQFILSQHT